MPQIFKIGAFSQIPKHVLRNMMDIIEARNKDVLDKWMDFFGEIHFYC